MTSRQQHPQEHCGHECVCSLYGVECWYGHHKSDKSEPCDMKGVLIKPCQHDTRTRSSSPAAAPEHFTCWRGDCKLHDNCIHSLGQEYPPCVDACAKQAAAKARAEVLDALKAYFEGYIEAAENAGDEVTVFSTKQHLEVLESLRGAEQEQEEEP